MFFYFFFLGLGILQLFNEIVVVYLDDKCNIYLSSIKNKTKQNRTKRKKRHCIITKRNCIKTLLLDIMIVFLKKNKINQNQFSYSKIHIHIHTSYISTMTMI